jgi:hypothetical protein
MTALAQLPADQQAVLDLVLRRGRSYVGIARALHLEIDAVRARALAGVSALGASAWPVPGRRRAQITDWLLGQADPQVAEDVHDYLCRSRSGLAWARSAAQELGTLAGDRLPELPAIEPRPLPPTARLAAVATPAVLTIAVALVIGSRGEAPPAEKVTPLPPSAWLAPTRERSDADGAAEVVRRGSRESLAVVAGGLPRSTETAAYTVWLTRGGRSEPTYVATLRTDGHGRIDGLAPLRVDPARYREVLITRQGIAHRPTRPGEVYLRGSLR